MYHCSELHDSASKLGEITKHHKNSILLSQPFNCSFTLYVVALENNPALLKFTIQSLKKKIRCTQSKDTILKRKLLSRVNSKVKQQQA